MALEPPGRSRVVRMLDGLVGAASWLWLVLVGVILAGVGLRTLLGISRIELEELQWHLYAFGFLAGIVGCALHDRHVRVDVFRDRMNARRRSWVDLYGLLLFELPFLALILWSALPLVVESFAVGERSSAPGGLGGRWLFKAALPVSAALVLVAAGHGLRGVARFLFDEFPKAGDGEAPAPEAGDRAARPDERP